MRVIDTAAYTERRDAISHDWVRFVESLGLAPVLLPNCADVGRLVDDLDIRLLLLTSGNDVHAVGPVTAQGSDVSPDRNRTESLLLDLAVERRLPVFGVCRGLQMMNTYFGGGLVTDLGPISGDAAAHVARPHSVTITDPSALNGLPGATWTVNSFHRQAVTQTTLASPLRTFARADDGVIEGLYHAALPMLAVQWHPERPGAPTELDAALVNAWAKEQR